MDLRPNRILSQSEKQYKIYLKQLLKEQHVLYKYSMRYQQAVQRKDHTVAIRTLQQLTQLQEQIIKRCHYDSSSSHDHSDTASVIHDTHILNDPFLPQYYHSTAMEEIDDAVWHDISLCNVDTTSSSTTSNTTTNTNTNTNTNNRIRHRPLPQLYTQPSKERIFIERFYQQLLHHLSSLSMTNEPQISPSTMNDRHQYQNHEAHSNRPQDEETTTILNARTKNKSNRHCTTYCDTRRATSGKNNNTTTTKIAHATTYAVTRELLRDMTKGTQHIDQFDNYYALLGYTRHKFIERAMLVVSSLNQIVQLPSFLPTRPSQNHPCRRRRRFMKDIPCLSQWKQRILSIRTMTSIGCGPGCDAVGVVAVLRSAVQAAAASEQQPQHVDETTDTITHNNNSVDDYSKRCVLDRIVLLDWAMEQWYHPIVECVSNMLSPPSSASASSSLPNESRKYVQSVICETCDVRQSVEQQYPTGKNVFTTQQTNDITGTNADDGDNNDKDNEWLFDTDLVVISYLLSETRNAWYAFMDEYVRRCCKVGTLFLITDPTAWQLHLFRQRYEFDDSESTHDENNKSNIDAHSTSDTEDNVSEASTPIQKMEDVQKAQPQLPRRVLMEFQWLDSSMYRPELQELEGRNGPGVLLAMKVAHSHHNNKTNNL